METAYVTTRGQLVVPSRLGRKYEHEMGISPISSLIVTARIVLISPIVESRL